MITDMAWAEKRIKELEATCAKFIYDENGDNPPDPRIKELEDDKVVLQASYEKALDMISDGNKRIKELQAVVDRLADKKPFPPLRAGPPIDVYAWQLDNRIEYAQQHATKEEDT